MEIYVNHKLAILKKSTSFEYVAENRLFSGRDGEHSVYVGTYAKYNEGSHRGLWIDLSSFNDYD